MALLHVNFYSRTLERETQMDVILPEAAKKLIGMEGNRYLDDGHSIIAGPFFVCGLTEDDFRGLTEEEVQKYMNKYAEPENISQEEVEADTGFMLYPM